MPREETTLLCVGQYLNGSEEKGVGEREVSTCGPRWKEGEDIWTCCPGLRWVEEMEIGDLRPVSSLILELWQEATLWAAGPEHLPGGLGLGLSLGLCKMLLSLPDFWANSVRCVDLSWRDKDIWKRKKGTDVKTDYFTPRICFRAAGEITWCCTTIPNFHTKKILEYISWCRNI